MYGVLIRRAFPYTQSQTNLSDCGFREERDKMKRQVGNYMEQKYVNSFDGSSQPSDVFSPYMPGVDLLSDMDALFDKARHSLLTGEYLSENDERGQRAIAIVTPGRMAMFVPCPTPGSVSDKDVAPMAKLMPPEPPLNISVVSYTFLESLIQDKTKCIPFLGHLAAWGYIGHSVVCMGAGGQSLRTAPKLHE